MENHQSSTIDINLHKVDMQFAQPTAVDLDETRIWVKPPKQRFESHKQMLSDALAKVFGYLDSSTVDSLLPKLSWIELAGGDFLVRQGDSDTSLYFLISGRLRALHTNSSDQQEILGDVLQGETVGEMAFFTQQLRTADVIALRDSVLVKFTLEAFKAVLQDHPLVSMNMTRLIIERNQKKSRPRSDLLSARLFSVVGITESVNLHTFAKSLCRHLADHGTVVMISSTSVGQHLGDADIAQAMLSDAERSRKLSHHLELLESEYDYVVVVADREVSEWSRRCMRHSDEVLLVADAQESSQLSAIESSFTDLINQENIKNWMTTRSTLILLHPQGTRTPSQTKAWFKQRDVYRHFHLRVESEADWKRISRTLVGKSIGLVLSGGGARGFAHLGVMRALEEAGMGYDCVGGTSIGAVMAALAAMDLPVQEVIAQARATFKQNPTRDFNFLPVLSLIGGQRMRKLIDQSIVNCVGHSIDIEDLWKPYFCITSNYSYAREAIWRRGSLTKTLCASVAIPGALPPIMIDGDLHIDGGTFNNFPIDVMRQQGVKTIMGVDLMRERAQKYELEELPGPIRLALDNFRGNKNKLPNMGTLLLNASLMGSYARQRESRLDVDVLFTPPAHRFGMLDWKQMDRLVQLGYEHACEVLASDPSNLSKNSTL